MNATVALLLLAAGSQIEPGRPDAELDRLFDRSSGWTGGDAAYSVPLGKDRTLWLFGDTWIDRYGDAPRMINNSVGVQSKEGVTFHWGEEKTSFFLPSDGKGFLWPGAGVRVGKPLYLFLHRVEHTKSGGPFGFVQTGMLLARVADPDLPPGKWNVEVQSFPWFRRAKGGNRFFGAGALVSGDRLYVYGADEQWQRGFGGRALIAARVETDKILDFSSWRFLTGGEWASSPDAPDRLCEGVGAEYSVSRLPSGRFVLVTTQFGLSPRIQARFSETPVGPWSEPQLLYECPEVKWSDDFFCYAGKAHPELARGNELVVTYACNGKDFGATRRDRRIYRPRFVRVPLPQESAKILVHVDADTGNEVDDLYAIARALVEPKFKVVGLSSSQYFTQKGSPARSADVSQALNENLLRLLGRSDLPHPVGSNRPLADGKTPRDSPAARFIVEQARAVPEGKKLTVLAFGAVTNVASAVLLDPSIVPRLRVGAMLLRYDASSGKWNRKEFNANNDQKAVDVLLNTPGLDLVIMTATASRPLVLRKKNVEAHLKGKRGAWDALVDRWDTYLKTMTWSIAGMDHSKEWVMWDIAIVEAIADPSLAKSRRTKGPTGRDVTVYTSIDADAMRAAFWKAIDRAAGK